MQKIGLLSLLFDFYSSFLTEKQRKIFELYYFQDLSLGEIAESYNISRQAVYDIIKRSEHLLFDYENKLALYKKYSYQKKKLEEIRNLLIISNSEKSEELVAAIRYIDELIDFNINN